MTQEQCETTLSLLTGVLDYECFKDVDMVIEVKKGLVQLHNSNFVSKMVHF